MSKEFEILDLTSNLPDYIEAFYLLSVQHLYGNFVLGQLMHAD